MAPTSRPWKASDVATIDRPESTPALEAPPGTVLFTSSTPLNATIRILGPGGGSFDIRGPVKGEAVPAGEPFPCPAAMVEAFEREYGPRPDSAGVSPTARGQGRIPGLTRL